MSLHDPASHIVTMEVKTESTFNNQTILDVFHSAFYLLLVERRNVTITADYPLQFLTKF